MSLAKNYMSSYTDYIHYWPLYILGRKRLSNHQRYYSATSVSNTLL